MSSASRDWLQLPQLSLVSILERLHTVHLADSALVCTAWCDASRSVGSATAVLRKPEERKGRSLDLWLDSHGGQLRSLELSAPDCQSSSSRRGNNYYNRHADFPFTALTQLTSLKLCNLEPTFDTGRSCSCCKKDLICACTLHGSTPALVQLNLRHCGLSLYTMQHLTAFTSLTMLEMSSCTIINRVKSGDDKIEMRLQALCKLLQALPDLQDLKLCSMVEAAGSVLATVSSMQRLQRLSFQGSDSDPWPSTKRSPVVLSELPTSLTALLLSADGRYGSHPQLVLGTSPDLGQHTRLQELQLAWVTLEVAVVHELPHLRRLRLTRCDLKVNPNDHDGDLLDNEGLDDDAYQLALEDINQRKVSTRTEALLTALGRLTQLQELQLHDMGLEYLTDLQYATGLTASSQLTSLLFTNTEYGQPALPKMALQHMLMPGMQLPHLQRMELAGLQSMQPTTANVTAEDIAHIAAACPALDTLRLVHVLADSAAVAALSQLGGLAPGLADAYSTGGGGCCV